MKIPEWFELTGIKSAMQILQNDPNFMVLKKVVEENDIYRLSQQLEDGVNDKWQELSEKETQAIRYRLRVLKEVFQMPKVIISEIESASNQKPEEGRDDPYATEEDMKQ